MPGSVELEAASGECQFVGWRPEGQPVVEESRISFSTQSDTEFRFNAILECGGGDDLLGGVEGDTIQ